VRGVHLHPVESGPFGTNRRHGEALHGRVDLFGCHRDGTAKTLGVLA
jgi:hypothetical protein